jgi:hypothetical protein
LSSSLNPVSYILSVRSTYLFVSFVQSLSDFIELPLRISFTTYNMRLSFSAASAVLLSFGGLAHAIPQGGSGGGFQGQATSSTTAAVASSK